MRERGGSGRSREGPPGPCPPRPAPRRRRRQARRCRRAPCAGHEVTAERGGRCLPRAAVAPGRARHSLGSRPAAPRSAVPVPVAEPCRSRAMCAPRPAPAAPLP